jgi:hypothetical protein
MAEVGGLLYWFSVECEACKANDEDPEVYVRLAKCAICFKVSCENCATKAFGRIFCNKRCSDQFFFGDDDD